jgi:small subunit ribosomal protein S17
MAENETDETQNDVAEDVVEAEPEAAEAEPAEEAAAPEEAELSAEAAVEPEAAAAEDVAPPEAASEPEPEPEAAAGADAGAEAPTEEPASADEPAAAAPAAEPKRKKKRLPRSLRRTRPKRTRAEGGERKPIVRVPKPESDRGRRQERQGVVVSSAMDKTIVVKVDMIKAHRKYKKVVRRSVKFHAHDEGNTANVGDIVRIVETRPLSATKRWRLAEIVEAAK